MRKRQLRAFTPDNDSSRLWSLPPGWPWEVAAKVPPLMLAVVMVLAFGAGVNWGGEGPRPKSNRQESRTPAKDVAKRTEALVLKDMAYGSRRSPYQTLNLTLPSSDGEPVPLVIWIHGGAWRAGDKNDDHPAKGLTAKGFAVASINYRLSTVAAYPAQLDDCQAAVRFLRSNAEKHGIDPNRIGVWGSSAGGHLAAMLGVLSDGKSSSAPVQAVCDWFGPTDLVNAITDTPKDSPLNVSETLWQLFLGPRAGNKQLRKAMKPDQRKRLLASGSPIRYVTGGEPPFLIMHGDADKTVPIVQSRRFVSALQQKGVQVTFREIPGAGHRLRDRPKCITEVEEFFERTLKKRSPESNPNDRKRPSSQERSKPAP